MRDGLNVAALARATGPCLPVCRADMNGDGVVDDGDHSLLLLVMR